MEKTSLVSKVINLCLESRTADFKINSSCSVVENITTLLPRNKININAIIFPKILC